jgi:hypothetical protein
MDRAVSGVPFPNAAPDLVPWERRKRIRPMNATAARAIVSTTDI